MCELKDVWISHEFEKEDVAALFENWREVGRGVGEWEGGCGKGSVWEGGCVGLGLSIALDTADYCIPTLLGIQFS